ncbi:MAG: TatD family hydrolase [gamma proteobacterium symbiont of Taylorina sp.]|nr:TatD family hydrolase [gamma proteobacterium symbiont of Taylorina sp.]
MPFDSDPYSYLIDTHCHLDFPIFDNKRDNILQVCKSNRISSIVIPGVCSEHWQRVLQLCQQHCSLYPALGLHPCFIDKHKADDLEKLAQLCAAQSMIAIGEIGLDYYKVNHTNDIDKEKQKSFFSQQLQIAEQYHLPVLIHARKSHFDVIEHLKKHPQITGIIHAYSGSYEQAEEYLQLGFKLGFGGAYTYPKATRLRSLLVRLPLSSWVLETDAPDMTPCQYQGQVNSPQYLQEIAQEFINLYTAALHMDMDFVIKNSQLTDEQVYSQLNNNVHEVLSFI